MMLLEQRRNGNNPYWMDVVMKQVSTCERIGAIPGWDEAMLQQYLDLWMDP